MNKSLKKNVEDKIFIYIRYFDIDKLLTYVYFLNFTSIKLHCTIIDIAEVHSRRVKAN